MSKVRIALANVKFGESANQSVTLALEMIADAARQGAVINCFPESFVPSSTEYLLLRYRKQCDSSCFHYVSNHFSRRLTADPSSVLRVWIVDRRNRSLQGHWLSC
jgi:transposase